MKKHLSIYSLTMVLISLSIILGSCAKEDKNNSPTIASVTVSPNSIAANGVVSVTVVASDQDGDALTYAYNVSGGAISGSGASATWTAPSIAGSYSVTVTVSDGNGGQASSNGSLTVTALATQITGTAKFPAGTSGDLSNAKVSLYTTKDNWYANQPIKFGSVSGSGAQVTFALTNVNPGNYYLDVWKDNDNTGDWSFNDFIGWYGQGGLGSPDLTEIQIAEGQTIICNVNMYIISK